MSIRNLNSQLPVILDLVIQFGAYMLTFLTFLNFTLYCVIDHEEEERQKGCLLFIQKVHTEGARRAYTLLEFTAEGRAGQTHQTVPLESVSLHLLCGKCH